LHSSYSTVWNSVPVGVVHDILELKLISFRPLPCQVFFYFGRLLDDAPLLSFHELLVFLGTYPSCQRDDHLSPGEGGLYTACQAGR